MLHATWPIVSDPMIMVYIYFHTEFYVYIDRIDESWPNENTEWWIKAD